MQRVLIGCPTYDGQSHCISRFLEQLKLVKGPHDALFVDNSEGDEHANKITAAGFEVARNKDAGADKIARIISNRQKIIDRMLQKNYDYLLFLDTDVLPPQDIIPRLLAHKKDLVTGIYLGAMKIQGKIRQAPVIYDFSHKKDYFKPVPLNSVLDEDVREIAACGFGCVMITRQVVQKVELRYNKELGSGEDIPFCRDARELHGFKTFVDTSIKCTHMQKDHDLDFPAGIAHFSFEYELE
ncbi:MAG: hypothetical protein HY363_03540 [Candidatus Aenigmarchaeota archaeon]|nr:hypothetical protein [Candidatus Aenigmarchaeota archaeon]